MEWISILKCPITGDTLHEMYVHEIHEQELKRSSGRLWNVTGEPVATSITQCLITKDGRYRYPVINGILIMLPELAMVDAPEHFIRVAMNEEKQWVKNFYDKTGWITDEAGNYEDAVIYEDLRDVSKDYIKKCHNRVSRYLSSGTYLLDAASGAIQYPDYLQYSENYTYRICVDFSFRALKEAKRKLGDKGICVLCDMTNLPFHDKAIDGFVSLNTIYHIPKDEQVTAINELYRVLIPQGKGVVVYDWYKHSPWMNIWMFPFRAFVFIKNRLLDTFGKWFGKKGASRRLYFYAHKPAFFKNNLPPHQLKVWRTVSVPFLRYYIHPWIFGRQILSWLYKQEELNPELHGLKGEYPMLVFEKK